MGKGGAPAGDQKISVLLGDDALIGNAIEPGGLQSGAVSPAVGIGGVIGPGDGMGLAQGGRKTVAQVGLGQDVFASEAIGFPQGEHGENFGDLPALQTGILHQPAPIFVDPAGQYMP